VMEDYRDRLRLVVREVMSRGFREELEMVLEGVEALFKERSGKTLVQRNLVIYKKVKTLAGKYVREERELGVGGTTHGRYQST